MSTPILATKLYVPPPRPKTVLRPRLFERLDEALHHKLTLITAPPGYGKTTLLSKWIAESEHRVTWLSLDRGDSDPVRFWTYFIAALETLDAELGKSTRALMQSPLLPPVEVILTNLLNEINAFPDHFALVLDDYHVVDARPIDEALTFLLEHLPPRMHLIIATREDPNLPLARLRAQGQLIEVRAKELRFAPSEVAEFLDKVMGLSLSAEDIALLEARTEGWIAGLQLAALSLQTHEDVAGFIRAFAGDNRYIVDYLIEEVLQRQPEAVRTFLLQTAILDRLNGPLCDAVTGQAGGRERLEALQRGNFFVVPLDDKRHWYRYHHLFAEVLYVHLAAEQPDQLPILHRRASEWHEHHGSLSDAIHHALAGRAFERAADLVELAWPAVSRSRQDATLLGWLRALPDELLQWRPMLSVYYAHILLASGKFEGVEKRLQDAERWLETATSVSAQAEASSVETRSQQGGRMIVIDDEAFRRLPGAIGIARAGLALARGDVPGTVAYARRTLDLAPEGDHLTRGGAAGFLGLAFWASGELEAAHRMYAEGMASLQRAGNIADAINGSIALAAIRIAQGRLREAMSTYERGLQLATAPDGLLRGAADMYVGMGELHCEHNDLHTATLYLLRSQELGEHAGFPQNRYRWYVAMAQIRQAQGDLNGALDLLQEAERLYISDFSPNVRPVAALRARVWLAQGRLEKALSWARGQGVALEDELSYLREFEHITLARLLLAHYKSNHEGSAIGDVLSFLERLLKAAKEGGRIGSVIEILILQALAYQAQDDIPAAVRPLQRALTLAEPEGFVRIFLNEGSPMVQLLGQAVAREILPAYTEKLLEALREEQPRSEDNPPLPTAQPLPEPLSQRELEILRLFKTELSGPEIAHELVIALSTVRTHTKGIYSKLNVNSRRAAVKRATELNII